MNLEQNVQYINIENIIPNRFQPRLTFDENALKELSQSIKELGIIQPLVLRRLSPDKYEIIAGERRYKASQMAGLKEVPAIIADLDDNTSAEVALVENLQRKNLSAMEEAKSYETLLKRGYVTQEQLAKRLGISQSTVANKVRLLKLTDEVQDALMKEKISERHARSLLQLTNPEEQKEMLNKVINDRMTVRQLDTAIKNMNTPQESNRKFNNFISLEEENNLLSQIEQLNINDNNQNSNETPISNIGTENDIAQLIVDSKKDLENKYEIFDIPTAEEEKINKEPIKEEKETKKIIKGDINSVINSLKEIVNLSKKEDFSIETEEYDFEDLYQIIIKIEK